MTAVAASSTAVAVARVAVVSFATGACLDVPSSLAEDAGKTDTGGCGACDAAPTDEVADAAPVDPRVGDVVYLSFDGADPLEYAPGKVATASINDGFLVTGIRGAALDAAVATLTLDDLGEGAAPPLTIEAWINSAGSTCRAILSDDPGDDGADVDLEFRLTGARSLAIKSDGTAGLDDLTAASVALLADTWTHVAVTWDGSEAAFYLDGEERDRQAMEVGAWTDRGSVFHVGQRVGGGCPFTGLIDEVKLSSYVKTADDLLKSIEHDPSMTD